MGAKRRSSRWYNADIPIALCLYGGARAETLAATACATGVQVEAMGEYPAALGDIPEHRRSALVSNPTLHKLLSLRSVATYGEPLIYLDCDSYFFGDVTQLSARYDGWDFCARQEPLTLRSAEGHEWTYIDEHALAGLAMAEGLLVIPAYNTGVMLISATLAGTLLTLLDDFICTPGGCCTAPACGTRTWLATTAWSASCAAGSGPVERRLALPYPAASIWIFEQIATWLTLGRIPGLAHHALRQGDVAQGDEVDSAGRRTRSADRHAITSPPARPASSRAWPRMTRPRSGRGSTRTCSPWAAGPASASGNGRGTAARRRCPDDRDLAVLGHQVSGHAPCVCGSGVASMQRLMVYSQASRSVCGSSAAPPWYRAR